MMYVNIFICLEENVTGYGKNKRHPSGHVTITTPGVVKCYIQDLENIAKPYIVYLVSKKANKAIRLGQINCTETTKQTIWKIDLSNIQGSNVGARDIDCVVVVVEGEGIGNTDTVLAGYAKDKYMTTSLVESALPKKVKPEVKSEVKPMPKPEVKPEAKPMPKPEVKPEAKPMPKPEVKPETKPMPKPEVKPEAKPMPKPEVKPEAKPMPKPEVKPEVKPMPKPEVEPEATPCPEVMTLEEPGSVIVPEEKSEDCNCGFQVKDGKVEEEIIKQIKNMFNREQAKKESKEELEEEILSQVKRILDKDDIEDRLKQDFKDLQAQLNTILNMGVSELDRAEEITILEEEMDKSDSIEEMNYLEEVPSDGEENAYLKDIEKVLQNIQEAMQSEMLEKKKSPPKNW